MTAPESLVQRAQEALATRGRCKEHAWHQRYSCPPCDGRVVLDACHVGEMVALLWEASKPWAAGATPSWANRYDILMADLGIEP